MTKGSRVRVLKHCPEGHTMEMLWRTCPKCTGEPPLMQPEPRDLRDATIILAPLPVVTAPSVVEVAKVTAWALVVTDGILPGARIDLRGRGVRVGRAPSSAGGQEPLTQPDQRLSRDHFAVVPDGDTWVLHDVGSSNGTFVNGEKVTRRTLQPGDEVRAGHTTFRVEDHDERGQ